MTLPPIWSRAADSEEDGGNIMSVWFVMAESEAREFVKCPERDSWEA